MTGSGATYKNIRADEVPVDAAGIVQTNVYIHRAGLGYILLIPKGKPFSEDKKILLRKQNIAEVFVEAKAEVAPAPTPKPQAAPKAAPAVKAPESVSTPPEDPAAAQLPEEVIGPAAKAELDKMLGGLKLAQSPEYTKYVTQNLSNMADEIINVVAPESKELKKQLLGNTKYLNLMNDAAAMTTLSILVAHANHFESRRCFKDLSTACLLMDLSMMDFRKDEINAYYANRNILSPDVLQRFKEHPLDSYNTVRNKMKNIPDTVLELILTHHELHNGKGFPRGKRYEMFFPLCRVLSFAVDLFEILKKAELNKKPLTLEQGIELMKEANAEPHNRRQSRAMLEAVLQFLK